MCDERQTSNSNQNDSLCSQPRCELRKKGGVWICCMCRFGYKGADRNRYGICSGCPHEVCEDCKAWNADTVAEMEAEDAANPQSDDTTWSPNREEMSPWPDDDEEPEEREEE